MQIVEEKTLLIYQDLFANRIPYKTRQIKELLPLVSKLGIMAESGKIEEIAGSINFNQNIDASRPSRSTEYRKPGKWATDAEVETSAIPKEVHSNRLEYDFAKVLNRRGKDSYNIQELIFWYQRLTGFDLPSNITRDRLEALHKDLDINRGKQ